MSSESAARAANLGKRVPVNPRTRSTRQVVDAAGTEPLTGRDSLDLENYVPYYINMLSNKLTRGSSRIYLAKFGIGVIEWRILGFLKNKNLCTTNEICQTLAIDKAAASRALQQLEKKSLVRIVPVDRRQNVLSMTAEGAHLHAKVLPVALERENILLSALSSDERKILLGLLRKLRSNISKLNEFEAQRLTQ